MAVDAQKLDEMFAEAWRVRERALIYGETRVGCSVCAADGTLYSGCNVEHQFRSHDVHAEISALSAMVSGGRRRAIAVAIVAKRARFTPCGACMDWIMELGGPDCVVAYEGEPSGNRQLYRAGDLMPHYPL